MWYLTAIKWTQLPICILASNAVLVSAVMQFYHRNQRLGSRGTATQRGSVNASDSLTFTDSENIYINASIRKRLLIHIKIIEA